MSEKLNEMDRWLPPKPGSHLEALLSSLGFCSSLQNTSYLRESSCQAIYAHRR